MESEFRFNFYGYRDSKPVRFTASAHREPIDAIDEAESYLQAVGSNGNSFCEVMFNGDPNPHYLLFKIDKGRTGIFNTDACRWPVYYPEGTDAFRDQLTEIPWEVPNDGTKPLEQEDRRTPEEDAGSDFTDQDAGEESGEDGGSGGDEESDDDEGSDEAEPMRLTFFSRMRGPKGWRRKAETDPERDYNSFIWRIGIQDEDGREGRESLVTAVFRERDTERTTSTLTLTVPEGTILTKDDGKKIEFIIPTQGE